MPREAPTATATENPVGGAYLKHGTLKREVVVAIDDRRVREDAPEGVVVGSLPNTVDIPVSVSGIPYVLTVSTKSGDYAALVRAFGKALDAWTGSEVRIFNDADLPKVRIAPLNAAQ
jgi:hypothetical protein